MSFLMGLSGFLVKHDNNENPRPSLERFPEIDKDLVGEDFCKDSKDIYIWVEICFQTVDFSRSIGDCKLILTFLRCEDVNVLVISPRNTWRVMF